ncbi:MAG: transcription-repair coupling factor [Candidatus Peribacteria bacterium]|nr:transcription-repair coupling factor [Candidatus Peribacteria bacterium]
MKPSLLLGDQTHRELSELLQSQRRLIISGASNETAKALLLSHLLFFKSQPVLLVTPSAATRDALLHWLGFFEQRTEPLAAVENEDGHIIPHNLQSFLSMMQEGVKTHGGHRIFAITRKEWDCDFPLFAELNAAKIILKAGEKVNFTSLFESLIENGYVHGDDLYLQPGQYRRIGDTLDIYPIQSSHFYRVAFNFDTVEKILTVSSEDLSTTADAGPVLEIFPATYAKTKPLMEQLPKNMLLVLDDQDDVVPPLSVETLSFTAFPESQENHAHLRYLSVLKFYTLTDFLNDVRDKLTQQWRLIVVTKRADELTEILKEEHIPHTAPDEARQGALTVIHAEEGDLLPHSLQNPDMKCALLTDREIFSLRKSGKQKSMQKMALEFITSLQAGDYVVHMDHGIGHFEGTVQKTVDGITREYLELSYAGGDKLFTPVDQADKLSKYVYEEGNEPVLTRLGTVEWKKLTEKMRRETKEIAKELLQLYAKRARARGHKFPDDSSMLQKFEASFPYQETPGQMKAIQDIKADMESDRPMDRLVCGDVGFGKTEVAMRAAFKAAEAGRQVAVIAPITILADQHFRNFRDRMKEFPSIKVEMLSRFRTPAEQKKILEQLRKGDVRIVIGTHRLLQDDVHFHNLGLVVIDEEQRFGVKQKEKFKDLRASVDILTLTATPIPRTLNLGLHKLRDITTITTPPPGRLPIITEVRKYSDELVRQAILAEIKRGGQSFMLHNRVETIDAFADKLRKMIPEATFVVGHGQLKPELLEERIVAFKDGKYDVLVSSTIIENGIDLPRANTLIVNEAERFGLSQLYQLRGRVGRGKVQAFAYFLYHTQKLKDDAKKRLRAIVEACELGSGFQVAMRDLEIRGAGEILGASQSGTMQTVGVSHYLRMLKHAMEELRNGSQHEEEEDIEVEIQLPVEAFIPTFYIPDDQEKISVYQKLAGSEDDTILQEFESDLLDEYGDMPEQVRDLFRILRLKMVARRAGVVRVKMEDRSAHGGDVVLMLSPRVTAAEIMQLLGVNPLWKISGANLRIPLSSLESRAKGRPWLEELTLEIAALVKAPAKKASKALMEV